MKYYLFVHYENDSKVVRIQDFDDKASLNYTIMYLLTNEDDVTYISVLKEKES